MASEIRHAAWQTERSFAVRPAPEGGPPADLASGLTEFLDAFDLASEWLDREDPARDGAATLAILETYDGVSEEVWTYAPAQPSGGQQLVARLGFNPLTWAGVPAFSAAERKTRLRQRVGATDPRAEATSLKVDHAAEAERATSVAPSVAQPVASLEQETIPTDFVAARIDSTERSTVRATARRWIRARVRATWDDRLSRCCLLFCGASLWFSLSLADPHFLIPVLVVLPALWWRQRDRGAPTAEADDEDWL